VGPWLIAIGGTALVTALGRELDMNPSTAGFLFLIVVLVSSLRGGLLVAMVASVIATLSYNFFFFPPLHTLSISEPANWVALAAFLVTSVIVNRLVIDARVAAERADQRRNELETLYALSIELFTAGAVGDATERALKLLGAKSSSLAFFDAQSTPELEHLQRSGEPLELPSPDGRDVYLPLFLGGKVTGALIARGTDASLPALVSASRLIGLALEREKFLEENAHVQALRESETLKTSLLRAISHDLTTPLTAITIHTEGLRRKAERDAELKDSVSGIAGETSRLRRRIDNLLAMARLEAGKAKPRREPTPPADLFRAVRENLPLVFGARQILVHVEGDCPDANVDPFLALEILVNLIENAHRVSPPETAIELRARTHPLDPNQVRIEVLDRGPGMPPGVADADGNLLAGATSDVAQRGLGLEIARTFAAANGGSLGITPRPGGGTIARIDVPAALLPESEPA